MRLEVEFFPQASSLKPHNSYLFESVQRESNSQFLLGKEMGYHYTMDAFYWLNQIVKDRIRPQVSGLSKSWNLTPES